MQIEQTIMIDGNEVMDSGQKIMGHRILELKAEDDSNLMYVVDSKGKVNSVITIYADCCQNSGYVSEFTVKDIK